DNGISWQQYATGIYTDLHFVHFSDIHNGIAISKTGSYIYTSDGGETWSSMLRFSIPQSIQINDIAFEDNAIWYIAGSLYNNGVVYKTTDAGTSWNIELSGNVSLNNISTVCMLNTMTGYAAGEFGMLLLTRNGGESWKEIPTPLQQDMKTIHFSSLHVGIIIYNDNSTYHTTDGGESWNRYTEQDSPNTISVIQINIDNSTGKGVMNTNQQGIVLFTENGGATVEQAEISLNDELVQISAIARSNDIVV